MDGDADHRGGYAIAAGLGLDAFVDLSGDDGTVYLLDDGRVIKVTANGNEAALALALQDLQREGRSHPGVPRIDAVYWQVRQVDLSAFGLSAREELTSYAILRESLDDRPQEDDERHALWTLALSHLNWGWTHGDARHIAHAQQLWKGEGDEIDQVLASLEWIRSSTGVQVRDIRASNLGVSEDGHTGVRDLGRSEVPEHLLERVRQRGFPQLPVQEAACGMAPR